MALNPITPGLRNLRNKSNGIAKVSIAVPAGDELVVSDDVATQLLNQTQAFEATSDGSGSHPEDGIVEEAGGGSARRASGRRKD